MEEWKELKDIVECGDYYAVSTKGRVKNVKTGRILKERISSRGYLFVALCLNGKYKQYLVHRLVALAFLPNTEDKLTVNHLDGNKFNNSVTNLEWATHSEQQLHATQTGLKVSTDNQREHMRNLGKLYGGINGRQNNKPVNQYNLNGKIIATFESGVEASKATGVKKELIYDQCRKLQMPRKHSFYFRYASEHKTG